VRVEDTMSSDTGRTVSLCDKRRGWRGKMYRELKGWRGGEIYKGREELGRVEEGGGVVEGMSSDMRQGLARAVPVRGSRRIDSIEARRFTRGDSR